MRIFRGITFWAIFAVTTAQAAVVGGDLTVNSLSAYAGQTNIVLQATGNITFTGGTLALPPLPPGAVTGLLTIQAGTNVVVNDGVTILAGTGWSVSIAAGVTSYGPPVVVGSGLGNIVFLGNGSLVVTDGSIDLLAGGNVTVGTGSIATLGNSGISVNAAGNVSAGSGEVAGQIGSVSGGTISISAGGTVSTKINGVGSQGSVSLRIAAKRLRLQLQRLSAPHH